MDYEGLEIRPGGLLISTYWDKESKKYKEADITDICASHIFDSCEVHPDTTLQDIFLLINSQIEMFTLLFGGWVEELTQEALKPATDKITDINYLELYWNFSYEEDPFTQKTVLTGTRFPSFHGIGQDTFYSVALSKVNDLAPLKLKLRDEIIIHDFREKKANEIAKFKSIEYTFGQIIYGIIWELTFYGSPKMRDDMADTLKARIDDIQSGKAKLIPWEEVKENIKKDLKS